MLDVRIDNFQVAAGSDAALLCLQDGAPCIACMPVEIKLLVAFNALQLLLSKNGDHPGQAASSSACEVKFLGMRYSSLTQQHVPLQALPATFLKHLQHEVVHG